MKDTDMNNKLSGICHAIINGLRFNEMRRTEFPDDPIKGLAVGDSVWTYNDDTSDIEEKCVVAVVKGVGLVLVFHGDYLPSLEAVDEETFALSKAEAALIFSAALEHDSKYHAERLEAATECMRLISHEEHKRE